MKSWEDASSLVFLIFGLNHPADKKMLLASSGNEKHKYLLHGLSVSGREREKEIMGLLWHFTLMVFSLM